MAETAQHTERDKKILALWNNPGASYKTVCKTLGLESRSVVSGALRRARKRGEEVRKGELFGPRPRTAKTPRSKTVLRIPRKNIPLPDGALPISVVAIGSTGELNLRLRKERSRWSANELCGRLPSEPQQCRWLEGDYLNGGAHACKRNREHVELALADDPFPYCEGHRSRVINSQTRRVGVRITMHPRYRCPCSVRV